MVVAGVGASLMMMGVAAEGVSVNTADVPAVGASDRIAGMVDVGKAVDTIAPSVEGGIEGIVTMPGPAVGSSTGIGTVVGNASETGACERGALVGKSSKSREGRDVVTALDGRGVLVVMGGKLDSWDSRSCNHERRLRSLSFNASVVSFLLIPRIC
jgi:hypothetical protein